MKIYDEAKDQSLLCIGFDFDHDSPMERELALRRFQPGVHEKEWWRYGHVHLGVRALVAYHGPRPVGHVEFIPIQHAPRPVDGQGVMMVNCLYVAEGARGQGTGGALLEAAEAEASETSAGMAVVGHRESPTMPASFFEHLGYHCVGTRGDERLLFKPFEEAAPPSFLPIRFTTERVPDQVVVHYVHCAQCPHSGWALAAFKRQLNRADLPVAIKVLDASDRATVRQLGMAHAVFVDGVHAGGFPPRPGNLLSAVRCALAARAAHTPPADQERPEPPTPSGVRHPGRGVGPPRGPRSG